VNNRSSKLLVALCVVLVLSNIALALYSVHLNRELKKAREPQFKLLAPGLSWLSVDEFLVQQKTLSTSLTGLRQDIEEVLVDEEGTYGVYIEDLTTGAWNGINEREEFVPASLMKIPILVATLKQVQQGEIMLEQTVQLRKEDLDTRFGSLGYLDPGYTISVRQLLESMIIYSDNTAVNTLRHYVVSDEEFVEVTLALGLPPPIEGVYVSPKEYSNAFRGLYYSTQLRRPFSEAAISILLKTRFKHQLPAKLPSDVQIAHKIGVAYEDETKKRGSYHDCGIVYLPEKPYLICVMSSGVAQEQADRVISEISRVTYEYMVATIE